MEIIYKKIEDIKPYPNNPRFTDEAFEKASQVNSNTQLYKQARKLNSCKRASRNIKELIEVR